MYKITQCVPSYLVLISKFVTEDIASATQTDHVMENVASPTQHSVLLHLYFVNRYLNLQAQSASWQSDSI